MSKRMFGILTLAISGAALAWLGYNIIVDEIPSFMRIATDPDKLVKWTWPLAFAAVAGAYLSAQKPEEGKKKAKKA